MPKIRITTDRKPWLNGSPLEVGTEVDATDADARTLINLGFAEEIKVARKGKGASDV